MKCFCHIGTEKTATTTIQKFMDLNRDELLKSGYIYTKSAGNSNNTKLPVTAYNVSRRDDLTRNNNIHSDNELTDFQARIIAALKEEIRAAATHAAEPKVVFSSEHLQSRLTTMDEIHRFKDILQSLGLDDVSIVVYLRNPAEIANSLFSNGIKNGNAGELPPGPANPYCSNICNHKATMEKFGAVFGEHALIPRIFEKKAFVNGSIIDDFLSVIGAPTSELFVIPEDANKSPSLLGVNILKRVNKLVPGFIDGKRNPLRANLISYVEKYLSNEKYVMPRHLFEQYDAAFKESNEWVRSKYFSKQPSLFTQGPYPEESKSGMSEKELDSLVSFIANIWMDKQKRINNLTRNQSEPG